MSDKELSVAMGVLKRTMKELAMYQDEVAKGQARLAAMQPNDDGHKQASQVLDESRAMVANTADRLEVAIANLARFDADEARSIVDQGSALLKQVS